MDGRHEEGVGGGGGGLREDDQRVAGQSLEEGDDDEDCEGGGREAAEEPAVGSHGPKQSLMPSLLLDENGDFTSFFPQTLRTTPVDMPSVSGTDPIPASFPSRGGSLDLLDKRLTTAISTLAHLGPLEWPLSVVGTWFGIPVTSMALLPAVLACVVEPDGGHVYVGVAALLVTLAVWFRQVGKGEAEAFYRVAKVRLGLSLSLSFGPACVKELLSGLGLWALKRTSNF